MRPRWLRARPLRSPPHRRPHRRRCQRCWRRRLSRLEGKAHRRQPSSRERQASCVAPLTAFGARMPAQSHKVGSWHTLWLPCCSIPGVFSMTALPSALKSKQQDGSCGCSACGRLPDGAGGDPALAAAETTAQRQHAPRDGKRGGVHSARPGRQGRAAGSWAGQGMQTGPGQAKPGLCTGVCRMKSWNWFNCEEGASLQ